MTKMINCYICGSWIKPNKKDFYKCPKCKATYKMIEVNGKKEIVRYYENYGDYIEK